MYRNMTILWAVLVAIVLLTYGKTGPAVETTTPTPIVVVVQEEIPCVAEVEEEPQQWAHPMTWEQFLYVVQVVMAESGNQTTAGQMAVAQCIVNTASETGLTPYEVVTVPKQYAKPWPYAATDSVVNACVRVFRDNEKVFDEPVRWFYNPSNGISNWHESKTYVATIGAHKFFS